MWSETLSSRYPDTPAADVQAWTEEYLGTRESDFPPSLDSLLAGLAGVQRRVETKKPRLAQIEEHWPDEVRAANIARLKHIMTGVGKEVKA